MRDQGPPARHVLAALGAAMVLAGPACRGERPPGEVPWEPTPVPDLGAVVARVGGVPIFAEEVRAQAQATGAGPRAALDDLMELHLLAFRARSSWPPRGAEAERLRKGILVQRLLEREFEARTRPEDIPDEVLRPIYDSSVDMFVHPRLVEVATVCRSVGKNASEELRAAARETMAALKKVVDRRSDRTPEDFQAIAAEERWRKQQVRHFRFLQWPDKPFTPKFGAAVSRLKTPGETTGMIEDEYGFCIARYAGERSARNTSFKNVRDELAKGYYQRWRQEQFLRFTESLARDHDIEQDPKRLTSSSPFGS